MIRTFLGTVLIGCAVIISPAVQAHGPAGPSQTTTLDPDRSLAISQDAIGATVGNYRLVASNGGMVSLDQYRGKPLLISLIYTGCTHICPMITQRLRQSVLEAQRVMGTDRFAVITVGFDVHNDTPMRMAAYARSQGIELPNWRAMSGDEATVAALAKDLGFSFTPSAGGFLHTAQVTLLDGKGRVYRQIYGDDFPIQIFMEPLKETVYGTVGSFMHTSSLLDRVRFLCTVYDPSQGRYRVSYAIAMSFLAGVISLGTTAVVVSRAWLNGRRATPS